MKLAAILILSSFSLAGCIKPANQSEIKAPFDEWYFSFSTPKALPAQVTLVKIIDVNGYGMVFRTIDQPQGQSVGGWDQHAGKGRSPFNKAKSPPRAISFCWDSIIDKKVYETTLIFHDETWQMMLTTEVSNYNPKEAYFFRFMVIGLAPEGKVRVWLKNNGRPNIEQTKTKIITVSGKDLDMCKGVTSSNFSYGYDEDIVGFIKGKKYPYGSW